MPEQIKNNKLFMASYSESELDSNFVVNSSESDSKSDSKSESGSSLALMNLDICISLFYTYTLLNILADNFFCLFS